MALLPPLKLSEQEKLEALQRLDRFRKWRSLDEKRYCLVCSTIITGREIHIMGGTRGTGPLRVICPSHGCHSIPMDWVLPTDEVLAKIADGPAGLHQAINAAGAKPQWCRDSAGSRPISNVRVEQVLPNSPCSEKSDRVLLCDSLIFVLGFRK